MTKTDQQLLEMELDPAKRETGTPSLLKSFCDDTPGQDYKELMRFREFNEERGRCFACDKRK